MFSTLKIKEEALKAEIELWMEFQETNKKRKKKKRIKDNGASNQNKSPSLFLPHSGTANNLFIKEGGNLV